MTLDMEIKKNKAEYIRIHSSGDFYNERYLLAWFNLCRMNPTKRFYAYTKSVALVKKHWESKPENLHVIFSYGGKEDHLINRDKDTHCLVVDTIPEGYTNGGHSDMIAAQGAVKKIAIVRH